MPGNSPPGYSRSATELLRALADHISAMIAYWDATLCCRFANRAYEHWFGVSPEALIGTHIRDLLGPLYELNLPYIEGALRGEPQEFEREIPDPAGGPARHSLAQYIPDVVDGEVRGFFVLVTDISKIKRAEDERRLFVALLENSSDFIGVADADGKPIYVNPAGRRMVGLPDDFPIERTSIPEYYPTEERAFATDVILASMVDRGRWTGETYFRHWQTEEAIPVSDAHFTIRDPEQRRVLGFGTITRDISESRRLAREREELLAREQDARARAEAANARLREAEERLRLTIDEAPIGMALVALDGRFIRVNRALCELVGYTADELMGLTFQAITHPEDLDTDLALAKRLLDGEIPRYQLGKRYVRKDGSIVDIMLNGSVLRGADGAPIHFIAQIEDVTERKRMEYEQRFLAEIGAALADSLEYEQTLATLAQLAVRGFADLCIVDLVEDDEQVRRLEVASRDPAQTEICEQLEQFPVDRSGPHILRSVLETKSPMLVPRVSEEIVASFAQGEEHLGVLRAARIESLIAVPLLAHGQLLGGIAFVSSMPGAYGPAELRLAEELAQRAARAIENARLYRTARRATQVRDDVMGIVAHDLRSPLGVILMQASQLRRREREEPAAGARRTPADVIERSATRMNRLIQDLLDVTRMEAKRLSIEAAPVPAEQLVTDLVDAHRAVAASRSLEIRTELPPDLPELWGDRDRLLQVFENLLGNALKFTKPGGNITLGAFRRSGEVLFWVRDTGSGIATEDVPHVFDRFWQARKTERRGAGLGLPIVKGIVEAHRGAIWVESTPGRGTTFFFTIPTAQRAAASREAPAPHAP